MFDYQFFDLISELGLKSDEKVDPQVTLRSA